MTFWIFKVDKKLAEAARALIFKAIEVEFATSLVLKSVSFFK